MSAVQSHTIPSAIADRTAQVSWQGSLAAGHGTIRSGSGALTGQGVTWVARTQQPAGKTSPEELCAAARSARFTMIMRRGKDEAGNDDSVVSRTGRWRAPTKAIGRELAAHLAAADPQRTDHPGSGRVATTAHVQSAAARAAQRPTPCDIGAPRP